MAATAEVPVRLVVGLGNPGPDYQDTPHNVGAATVRLLAERGGARLTKHRSRCDVASIRLGVLPGGAPGPQVHLAIARTFMNVSGGPLARLADYLGVPPQQILVVHDDLDLPAHTLRLKRGGGSGGHNGLKSLTQNLGTPDYARLRMGIGRPPGRMNPADYVMRTFSAAQATEWAVTYQQAADVVEELALTGWATTQGRLHTASANGQAGK